MYIALPILAGGYLGILPAVGIRRGDRIRKDGGRCFINYYEMGLIGLNIAHMIR
jgi:hypothetical protein